MYKIAKNIRHLRLLKNWTQDQLAEKLDVNRSRIGSYEEGRSEPPIDMLIRLSVLFHVAVDALIKCDLSKIDHNTMMKAGENRILFPIMVDRENRDMIEVVTAKVSAGYLRGYSDPDYIENLPLMKLPFRITGKHRTFPIRGDSMPPLTDGDYVVGKFIESLKDIRDGDKYIIVTKDDGITYKRVYHKNKMLELHADNKFYHPYMVKPSEVVEVWEFVCALNMSDYRPEELNADSIMQMLRSMKVEMESMQRKMR